MLLIILFVMFAGLSSDDAYALDWLAFGDVRGNIETCGCDPRTDLGGLVRLASLLERERSEFSRLFLMDLGNHLAQPPGQDVKNDYIPKALAHIKPDVSLFNTSELLSYQARRYPKGKFNFVLSNAKSYKKNSYHRSVKQSKALVLGYVWNKKVSQQVDAWSPKLKKLFAKELLEAKGRKKVLLFSGPTKQLRSIVKASMFDLIVSSNNRAFGTKADFREKQSPVKLVRHQSPLVRMVPLGAVGVLRGGGLQLKKSKSVADLMQQKGQGKTRQGPLFQQKSNLFAPKHEVSWLDRSFQYKNGLSPIFTQYELALANEFKLYAAKQRQFLKNSKYLGAQACKSCHAKAYDTWSKSRHAHAMQTLIKRQKHHDGECVSCHVLGYGEKGGFVSMQDSPQFAGVQCETCHGPRRDHAMNPQKPVKHKVQAKTVCKSCHHNPHSSQFDFKRYWKKISHGK